MRNKTRSRVVSAIIVCLMLLAMLAYFPPVHAVSPSVNSTCSSNDQTSTNVSCTLSSSAAGDTIIVWVGSDSNTGNPANTVVSIADGGDTFALQVSASLTPLCCSNAPEHGEIWSAPHAAGVSVTVTATMTLSGASVIGTNVNAISVSNIDSPTAISTATGSCDVNPGTCGTLTTTGANTFNPATDIAVGGWIGRGTSLFSNGANFTPNPTDGLGNCKIAGTLTLGCQEYTTNGAASPTHYPMVCLNCSSSNVVAAVGVGAIFGLAVVTSTSTSTITATAVNACTFTEIQCWWYPILFYGVFGGAFMAVGRIGQVEGRSMMFLLLAGLTTCSLIQVQMNMTNIMIPVVLSITGIAYAVRGR